MHCGRSGHSGGPPNVSWLAMVAPSPPPPPPPPPDSSPHDAASSAIARRAAPRAVLRNIRMGLLPSLLVEDCLSPPPVNAPYQPSRTGPIPDQTWSAGRISGTGGCSAARPLVGRRNP